MEHLVRDPARRTWVYYLKAEGMAALKVAVTLRARMVEKWIRGVKRDFLDAATTKCVGLDCEFTDPRKAGEEQRAAVLQLSVASETFCGAAIGNDVKKLRLDGIHITSTYDLQKVVPNPTTKPTPILYDLANHSIGTNLEQKKKYNHKKKMDIVAQEKEDVLIFGWDNYPLSYEQVHYAALDAHLGFEIARKRWMLVGY
ncbi:uncharacterized protein [Lolium perenne]|uniref:uncharacterized protein n=1 Tax=Lolium perenne TaxID=4522 RepID=UPI0021F6939B|nr:uncharacterized protein LOC127328616 [Lolium perenne]